MASHKRRLRRVLSQKGNDDIRRTWKGCKVTGVTPHDRNTYLVKSRTDAEVEYIVDLAAMRCGCPAALEYAADGKQVFCWHLERAVMFRDGADPVRVTAGSIIALWK
jgi:hypothetical protein